MKILRKRKGHYSLKTDNTEWCLVLNIQVAKVGEKLILKSHRNEQTNVGDPGLIPGSGRSTGEGNGNRLQYSCLENSIDFRGAWWAIVHGAADSRTQPSD